MMMMMVMMMRLLLIGLLLPLRRPGPAAGHLLPWWARCTRPHPAPVPGARTCAAKPPSWQHRPLLPLRYYQGLLPAPPW
jgi:hypothetical protein